jgi:hypothetical protein
VQKAIQSSPKRYQIASEDSPHSDSSIRSILSFVGIGRLIDNHVTAFAFRYMLPTHLALGLTYSSHLNTLSRYAKFLESVGNRGLGMDSEAFTISL